MQFWIWVYGSQLCHWHCFYVRLVSQVPSRNRFRYFWGRQCRGSRDHTFSSDSSQSFYCPWTKLRRMENVAHRVRHCTSCNGNFIFHFYREQKTYSPWQNLCSASFSFKRSSGMALWILLFFSLWLLCRFFSVACSLFCEIGRA